MAKPDPVLDRPILWLSDRDVLTFRSLIEGGCLITGGLGSGKSSTSGRALALGFLRAGLGGLVLTVKSDETQHWKEYAKICGRERDLIIFNAESGLMFDPLAYCWNQLGRAGGLIESIIELFLTLLGIGKQQVKDSSEGRYFELAVEELMRSALVMQSATKKPPSILKLHQIISSLPSEPAQLEDPDWQHKSECGQLICFIRDNKDSFTESQWKDIVTALSFVEMWSWLDPRTKGNILSTWSGMASKFTYSPLRELFCSGSYSFTPEQITHERKIIILDIPVLEFSRAVAILCQVMIKIVFQRAWLKHQYASGCCNGAFLFQDEFSMLIHRLENHFHQVVRGSAIAPVCLTPNINNIAADEFGEHSPGSRTLGFLGNLSVKIFHSQTDISTCKYAADLIGSEYRYLDSFNASSAEGARASVGGTQHLAHIIEPIELTRLLKPDGENPCAEAIVHMAGRTFEATKTAANPKGLNYLRRLFSRDI